MTTSPVLTQATFEPPGPGSWQLALAMQPRPAPRFSTELFVEPYTRGFREATKRYGLLLDFNESQFVNGFWYLTPRMVPADEIPTRLATAAKVFPRKLWREDLELWDREVKPASIAANQALQAVDPTALSIDALVEHIGRCEHHLRTMVHHTMRFIVPACLPVGDFLAHAGDWTGLDTSELLGLMRGASPVSAGAADELEPLVVGIRENKHSQALLESGESVDVLMALQSLSGRVGVATRSYLERVGYRLLYGWDVGQPYALEKPDVLVRAIRAAVEGARPTRPISELTQRVSEVRDRVPRDKRAGFDELLREARDVYRLREERTIFTVMWASGITRRTLLAAGEHLAARGRLRNPADVVEAAYPEIRSLLQGASRPSAAELSERAEYRRTARASDAPPTLGPAPQEPPPPDGLPAEALRVLRAMQTAVGALFGHSEAANEAQLIRGLAASPGVYEGVARVIADATELARLRRGDVLVAISTSESFNIALPLVGAIVTDWGGLLSHAAIVSRELGIPSVVGTREATASIPDGASVRVNGSAGEITILS